MSEVSTVRVWSTWGVPSMVGLPAALVFGVAVFTLKPSYRISHAAAEAP